MCTRETKSECKSFDFLSSTTRIGHNMTIDDNNDTYIHLSSIENYSFSHKDGVDPETIVRSRVLM